MKFDLMSDLHVDLSPRIKLDYGSMATSSIAVVAGDISNDPDTTILEIDRIAAHYEHVLFVDGNHEHYDNRDERGIHPNRTPEWVYAYLHSNFRDHPNVHYLGSGRTPVIIDNTAFVGANSWYDFTWQYVRKEACIDSWYKHMNDSHWANIDHLWVMGENANQTYNIIQSVEALNNNPDIENIVIVTHTVPTDDAIYNHPHNQVWNSLNGCYLNSQIKAAHTGKVKAHCFGHTHKKQMIHSNGVDFICNPRGYQGEPGFDNWAPIQIDLNSTGSAFGVIE